MSIKEDQIVNLMKMTCAKKIFKNFIKSFKLEMNHQNITRIAICNGDAKRKEMLLEDKQNLKKIKYSTVVNKYRL